jgi:pilus assembly protein Flp/PilA
MRTSRRFLKDEAGATAIEYGLIAALMATVIIAAFAFLTPALEDTFEAIANTMTVGAGGGDDGGGAPPPE